MLGDPTRVAALDGHRDFRHADDTGPIPASPPNVAGLAGASGHGGDVLVDGYAYGSLSMTSCTLDLAGAEDTASAQEGHVPALPVGVPPASSNM
ncbi:MAG: hypothetical protein H0T85_10425 [Geodermatophilaceae bacterium]|nr:hypothetical protein [Geodermatophilaceae bacterium]